MANWYKKLKRAFEDIGDNFEERKCTLSEEQLKVDFDDSYGEQRVRHLLHGVKIMCTSLFATMGQIG